MESERSWDIMAKTLTDRVTVLETENKFVINHIQSDLKEVKDDVKKIAGEMPELLRRVGKHHDAFPEHVKIIEGLQNGNCPAHKTVHEDNGPHDKRWLDQKKYKIMIWGLIITISGLLLSNMAMCAWVSNNFNEIIQSMPK